MTMVPSPGMAIAVETRSEAVESDVDRALIWAVHRRKVLAGIVCLVFAGAGAGWAGLRGIQASAEDRVLRRQAAHSQSQAVRDNGKAVEALGERMEAVESAVDRHADMTRFSVRLLLAHPHMDGVLERDEELRRAAAKVVSPSAE